MADHLFIQGPGWSASADGVLAIVALTLLVVMFLIVGAAPLRSRIGKALATFWTGLRG